MEQMESGFFLGEGMKKNSKRAQNGFSFLELLLGIVMVYIGDSYGPIEGISDPCPNGAAYWLYVAGIIILVINFMNGLSVWYQKRAASDGVIDSGEQCVMSLNSCSTGILHLVHLCVFIWGSVIVFGAWASWTYDYDEFIASGGEKNFCEYTPMMTAFVFLILSWVALPCLIVLYCCTCCIGLTCLGFLSSK